MNYIKMSGTPKSNEKEALGDEEIKGKIKI